MACNEEHAFFASEEHKKYDLWSCQKVTNAPLIYLLDNIYIRFGSKLYRQNVGIPMGTNCAPLVADLLLFCYFNFNFDIVHFPFHDGDVPQRTSYGVYISQLIRFARASSHVTDFNNRNKFLSKAIGIINSAKHFPNFIVGTLN